jgi:hypothetical protein
MDQFIALSQFWPLPLVIGEDLAEAADRIGTLRRATKFSTVVDRSEVVSLICMSVSLRAASSFASLLRMFFRRLRRASSLPFPPLQESAKGGE